MLFKSNEMPPILGVTPLPPPPPPMTQSQPLMNNGSIPLPVPAPQNNLPGLGMGNNFQPNNLINQDIDLRSIDPRMPRNIDHDMRSMQPVMPPNMAMPDPGFQRSQRQFPVDPRQRQGDPRTGKTHAPIPPPLPLNMHPPPTQIQQQPPQNQQQSPQVVPQVVPPPQQPQSRQQLPSGIPNDASDQEKAALIMQVLQLSDEQIAMLPPEQRASILVLKEQIAKSTGR